MSGTTLSYPSPTKSRACSSPPLHIPSSLPRSPKKHDPTTVTELTPLSRGSSVGERQDGDTDRINKRGREDYVEYVREDLRRQVFVDYEIFMQCVLHVPKDWETKWKPALDAVKADANFKKHHEEYCGSCNGNEVVGENKFYPSLVKTADAVLHVMSRSNFDGIFSKGLSPDLAVFDGNHPHPDENESLHWANPPHLLEAKPHEDIICDGENMCRLIVKGIDPIGNHAPSPERLRHRAKQPDSLTTPTLTPSSLITLQSVSESTAASTSRKRPADDSFAANPRAAKKSKTTSASLQSSSEGGSIQAEGDDEEPSSPQPEPRQQVEPGLQVSLYLWEMFSVSLLRSHATASLVVRDRLQLYYANRSVILVSSAINFSTDDGKDKLIATIIAQNVTLMPIIPKNVKLLSETTFRGRDRVVQRENELHFSKNAEHGAFKVKLTDVIFCDPAMVGRSTMVLGAESTRWKGPLVVKISWPTSDQAPETDFLTKASDMAEGEHEWAANHLPKVHYAEDVAFEADSTLGSVAGLFENAEFVNGNYVYERRTLRIIIQERLYPLKSLTNVKDLGQVFVDVLCVHRWLYDHPGILHRDVSYNNIMCRFDKETKGKPRTVYGVLTDYDLSSWTGSMNPDYTKTSQQLTGTPLYMAQELLRGTSPLHLYRHDVESLFYVMLMVSARHSITQGSTKPPYEAWLNERSYHTLGCIKYSFLVNMRHIELSPGFEDFRQWLEVLQYYFSVGLKLKPTGRPLPARKQAKKVTVQFDDETLGGCVEYAAILEEIPLLEGELKGLTIRYHKSSSTPGPPTSAGAA